MARYPAKAQINLITCPDHGSVHSGTTASNFYEFQGKVFFTAVDQIGSALYYTDGTPEGTEVLPWNDHQLCHIHDVHFWQHALYFVASHPETGEALYRYELPGTLGTEPELITNTIDGIHVYPNPTADVINIDIEGDCNLPMTFYLMNTTGSTVKQFTVDKKQSVISVNNLPAGIYLLKSDKIKQTIIKE